MSAVLTVQSLDPAFFDDRLQFSFLERTEDPEGRPVPLRESKTSGVVRLSNTGDEPLDILDAELSGPFSFLSPSSLDGLTLAAGASIDVTIVFDRSKYTPPTGTREQIDAISTVFSGQLTLTTNAASTPEKTVDLAGFWQERPENGLEPNLNEIFEIFGFGNRIEGLSLRGAGQLSALSDSDIYRPTDETEVLSPYWRIADGVTQARMTMIAAYRGPTNPGAAGINAPGDNGNVNFANRVIFWTTAKTDSQQLLPNASNNIAFGTRVFTRDDIPDAWNGDDVFGLRVEGLTSDPRLNPRGDVLVDVNGVKYDRVNSTTATDPNGVTVLISSLQLIQQGYYVRVFQAVDADGNPIPHTYIVAQDYVGLNYDYQDNIVIIEGVEPVGAFTGFESLIGDTGADTLTGTSASDSLVGLQGNDLLSGLGGDDALYGGTGADTLIGGAGADTLIGGSGNDRVEAGAGIDVADGGTGTDTLVTTEFTGDLSLTLSTGQTNVAGLSFLNFENVVAGSGSDTLSGSGFGNRLDGGGGADSILGNAGNDTLLGAGGNDTLNGGDAADQLFGGDDDDSLNGSTGNDLVEGDAGADSIFGGDGLDTLNGGDGNDTILGDRAADILNGGSGADSLNGGTANDTLNGDAGNDTLQGGDGNDQLVGGDGADNLIGGNNGDTLVGGAGLDTLNGGVGGAGDRFVFAQVSDSPVSQQDVITAFDAPGAGSGDLIDLSAIDANLDLAGDQAFVFGLSGPGGLFLGESGTSTVIFLDIGGAAGFDMAIRITDGATVLASAYTAADFVL
jgi:Ca2+-binding RTX toxin-like protein